MRGLRNLTVYLLAVSLSFLGMLPAQAGMVSSGAVAAAEADGAVAERIRIDAALDRADVQAALQKHGVSVGDAKRRVASLTDEEAKRLAASIDSAPAGGDVIGVLFTVFVILLVTDILGLTKVFPFTRSVRR